MMDEARAWLPSIGWVATAVFTASYFTQRAERLRHLQMLGAALWLVYGIAIGAPPVIVANLLVLAAATYTTLRPREAVAGAGEAAGHAARRAAGRAASHAVSDRADNETPPPVSASAG